MSGHIAGSVTPFRYGIWEHLTILADGYLTDPLTSIALIDDIMTGPPVELASIPTHEKALITFFDTCTNHGSHSLPLLC
jgi:hypothetical protein